MSFTTDRGYFESLKSRALGQLRSKEHLLLSYAGEDTQFVRLNNGKVRQIGTVQDGTLSLSFILEGADGSLRRAGYTLTLTGLSYQDNPEIERAIERLRAEAVELPADPFAQLPQGGESSAAAKTGKLLPIADSVEAILAPAQGLDLAGIYASGSVARAQANSAGRTHWFSTETFSLDYSLYTPGQRALKGTYAGTAWDSAAFARQIESARTQLPLLEKPARKLQPGQYRTYLAPAALHDLVSMFSWGCVSEAAIRQGESPLRLMRSEGRAFSPKFTLMDDFSGGEQPRFNDEGELAPERLSLIERGKLANTLVSPRTSKEYGVPSTGATDYESLRAPSVASGSLAEKDILARLGTGLYLSNLHYLNWSDQPGGRVTGMTRYACFWVESGEIVSPIENLRWDDTIFDLLGTSLEDFTVERHYQPEVGTYGMRWLGGAWMPGALLSSMKFTL